MRYVKRTRLWNDPGYSLDSHEEKPREINTEDPRGPDLVDLKDPALPYIYRAARQLIEFGYDPNDPDVAKRAIKVGRKMAREAPAVKARRYAAEATQGRHRCRLDGTMVVYYMRIGNRVKIGWSGSLAKRLEAINPEELMAVEPGGQDEERDRHSEFAALRTHGEWFRLESPLVEHIEALRRAETQD